ncbi:hypothetical protein [Polyangium jinanense]|uniref:Uncharacterized protein n=1 Tax=Polyangium jinanense TaxID=2829994 RepID=A0A9X3X0L8_9BACT|nr:hypothetical protein [Polyangium jinanense]MDC3952987.1 hypothetical protein [Polyangium jinanense]MDC3980605.1 hypothetical protein [Polyangium jinanense]
MRSVRPSFIASVIVCASLGARAAHAAPLPSPVDTLADVLRQTAAVIEGDVEDVSFHFDEVEGPRTVATVKNVFVHLGSLGKSPPSSLQIRSFGGYLPDGREIVATHVPELATGKRYFLFLRNTEWTLSPIAFGHVFRLDTVGKKRALVDAYGRLVAGVGATEILPGPLLWTRPSGAVDASTPPRLSTWITEADVDRALDAVELAEALRMFARATGAWPHGSFSPAPMSAGPWRRVTTWRAPTPTESPASTEGLLACFDPPVGLSDTSTKELAVCEDGGAP